MMDGVIMLQYFLLKIILQNVVMMVATAVQVNALIMLDHTLSQVLVRLMQLVIIV